MTRFTAISRIVCLILFSCISILSKSDSKNVIRLTNNDGLSNSSINCLYQDSRGLLWIGTWDGLNCYDGAKIKTFRPRFAEKPELSHPVVRRIFEDTDGMMWIATDYGINRYNSYNDRFDHYYLAYENKVIFKENAFDVCRDSKGTIVATAFNSGLYIFDPKSSKFNSFLQQKEIPEQNIAGIFFDKDDRLWLVCNKTLLCCTLSYADGSAVLSRTAAIDLPATCQQVLYDTDSRIWIQLQDGQLLYILTSNPSIKESTIRLKNRVNNIIHANGTYHFATNDGIIVCQDNETGGEHFFRGLPILSLLRGSQDILWVGSDTQGLFGLLSQDKFFTSYTPQELPELGMYAVRAFLKDLNNNLWIGTKGGGLLSVKHLGSKLGNTSQYTTDNGLPDNSVFALANSPRGDIWIGCDGRGLCCYSLKSGRLVTPRFIGKGVPPELYSIYALLQSDDTTLWVGTSGNGLFRLHITDNDGNYQIADYTHYTFTSGKENSLGSRIVYSLAWQNDTALWIATRGGGLNKLNPKTDKITLYKNSPDNNYSLSCNDVICVFIDSSNSVWAGTTNGLNRLVEKQGNTAFLRMTENNGLSNNNIHGILEDSAHCLWISTNRGISRIDLEQNATMHYYYDDGLQGNEFSDGASLASDNNTELYFGGINGFTVFHPGHISTTHHKPVLYLSAYNVNNHPRPLQNRYDTPIKLKYTENSLDLHFSIIEFIANNKCRLSYRLLRDNDKNVSWITIDDAREIILPSLVPGNYRLQVSYSNPNNYWYEADFEFPFIISPPWWQSIYAYIIYMLLFAAIIIAIFLLQRRKIMLEHSRQIDAIERNKEEEIHQAKLRFFTNIAHEFSNCITLIYGPCERISNEGKIDNSSREQLKTIRRNAERMQRLIQQLMDFRKAETGHLSMHFEEADIAEIVRYTLDYFSEIADKKKISVQTRFASTPVSWVVDRDAMEKIVFNLLSNAFKYSPDGGRITLELTPTDEKLLFSCTNIGTTIKPEDQHAIFNRFKVLDNFETKLSQGIFTRNGIGLAMCKDLSTLMNGSIFVESRQEGETTFTVSIGKNKPAEITGYANQEPSIPIAYASTPTGLNVLVVDDQTEIRSFISEILAPKYAITEAVNGQDAIDKLQSIIPDIIICDIVMPSMDGLTFLKKVKENEKTKHLPVILLTSRSSVESQIEGLENGAEMYIGKPFHPAYLLAAVDRVLGNKDIIKEYMQSPMAYTEQYKGRIIDRLDKEFIDKLMDILRRNLANEEFTLEMLANELAVSRVQLYRKIKQLTNRTPSEFIRNYRLQEAERLLRTTSHTVAEIMVMCGFQNKSYFYREFAKVYETTPKEYRKRQTEKE